VVVSIQMPPRQGEAGRNPRISSQGMNRVPIRVQATPAVVTVTPCRTARVVGSRPIYPGGVAQQGWRLGCTVRR
jgi:hypothetical protein